MSIQVSPTDLDHIAHRVEIAKKEQDRVVQSRVRECCTQGLIMVRKDTQYIWSKEPTVSPTRVLHSNQKETAILSPVTMTLAQSKVAQKILTTPLRMLCKKMSHYFLFNVVFTLPPFLKVLERWWLCWSPPEESPVVTTQSSSLAGV